MIDPPPRGRPRQFDRTAALASAMDAFWRRGYQDTSIAELTSTIGITATSLYAAFGSKAALFCEAADRYQEVDGSRPNLALAQAPTAREAVEGLLRSNVDLFTRRGGPKGCLLTRATLSCPPDDEVVRSYLRRVTIERVQVLHARLARARSEGEPLPSEDVEAVATQYDAMVQGLAVRAAEGAGRAALHRAVDLAMQGWDLAVAAARR